MKKILIALIMLLPITVLAQGYVSFSTGELTVEVGSSKTFTITAYNAIGDVSISSDNTEVATVNTNSWETGTVDEKQTKTGVITVTGKSIGSTNISLATDAATFDGEDISTSKKIKVNVIAKKPVASSNNRLKSLTIEGYTPTKVDDNNYTLTVDNKVTSLNILAKAEDANAIVSGNGTHEISIGENALGIIITSPSKVQNKINIIVTRKDGLYIEDLEKELNNTSNEIDITLNENTIITKEHLEKILNSKKKVNFNYYDETKKIIYSWQIDGKEIENPNDIQSTISFTSPNAKEIYKLSNYADGIYVNTKPSKSLPKKTKLKIYVADKFDNNSSVNIYNYLNQKLELIIGNVKVLNGYVEFEIEKPSEIFITMSTIGNIEKVDNKTNPYKILSLCELFFIVLFVVIFIIKQKSNIEKKDISSINNNNQNNNGPLY